MQLLRVVFIGAIMVISGDLLKINGKTVTGLKSYKITRAKLYSDAGRNLNGGLSATFIRVFPKLELEIDGILTKECIAELCGLLDQGFSMLNITTQRLEQPEAVLITLQITQWNFSSAREGFLNRLRLT